MASQHGNNAHESEQDKWLEEQYTEANTVLKLTAINNKKNSFVLCIKL